MGLINRQKELEIIAGLGIEKYENSKEVVFKHLLCCPITGLLMRDPVVGTDGYIYDRRALIALYERFKGGDAPHPFSDDILQRPLARENAEEFLKHNSLPQALLIRTLPFEVTTGVHPIYLPLDEPNHVFTDSKLGACLNAGDIGYSKDGTMRSILWIKSQVALKLGVKEGNWLDVITQEELSAMVKASYDAKRAGKQVACCIPANYCMINPVLGADFKVYSRMEAEWFFKNKRQFNRGMLPENQNLVADLGTEIYTWWNKTPQQLQHGIEAMAQGLKKHDEQLQKNNAVGMRRDTFGRTPFHLKLQYIDENTRLALVGKAMHLVQIDGNASFIGSTMEQGMVMSMSRIDITIERALERVAGTSLANKVLSTLVYSYAGFILISGSLKYVSAYILFKCDTIVGSLRCFIETWRGTPSFSDVAKATTFLRNMMRHGKEHSLIWQLNDAELGAIVTECEEVRKAMEDMVKFIRCVKISGIEDEIVKNGVHFFDKVAGHHDFDIKTDDQFGEGQKLRGQMGDTYSEAAQKINDICIKKYEPCDNARTSLSNAVVAIYINNMGRLLKDGSITFANAPEAMRMLAFVVRAFSTSATEAGELSITFARS